MKLHHILYCNIIFIVMSFVTNYPMVVHPVTSGSSELHIVCMSRFMKTVPLSESSPLCFSTGFLYSTVATL